MLRTLPALLLLAAATVLAGCSSLQDDTPVAGARTAQVERVVDGDTLKLAGGERVRLIGVDTPETKKPGAPVECFGRAASARTTHLLAGRRVRLVFDAERRDRYDRLLAYVEREPDGLDVGASLLRGGYAQTLTVPPNVARADAYRAHQRAAREDRRGLWAACR